MNADAIRAVAASVPLPVLSAFICVHLRFRYILRAAGDQCCGYPRAFSARLWPATPDPRAALAWRVAVRWLAGRAVRLVRYHSGASVARHLGAVRHPAPDDP